MLLIGCGLLTLIVLLLNLPSRETVVSFGGAMLTYSVLTAFVLNFGIRFEGDEFSAAHGVGMLALLSLPAQALPASLWAIAFGGVIGGLFAVRSLQQTAGFMRLLLIVARVTLSFYAGALVYGGDHPLVNLTTVDLPPLIIFGVVVSVVYLALYLVQVVVEGWELTHLRAHTLELGIMLLMPLPFAAVGAVIYNSLTLLPFGLYLITYVLILIQPQNISGIQLRQQVEELSSIAEMSKAIRTDLELETLLEMVYRQVSSLLGVEYLQVALYEDGKLTFPLIVSNGVTQTTAPDAASLETEPLLRRVLDTEQAVLVAGGDTPPDVHSWLGVPLLAGGQLLGALVVKSFEPNNRRFDSSDLRLLSIVAATASVALENIQLYRRQKIRVTQLATLNRVLVRLTDTLSPDTVVETVLSSSLMLGEASAASVYQFWDDAKLAFVRSTGFNAGDTELPEPLLVAARTQPALDQPPIVITDAGLDSRVEAQRPLLKRVGMTAWIELPLIYQGVALGVLAIYYATPHEFSPETIELLRTFANQSAQAITNARLYAITDETLERRVGQLLALAAIGHKLTTVLDLATICDLVAHYAQETTESLAAGVALIDSNHTVDVIALRGYSADTFHDSDGVVSKGITKQAVQTRDAVVIDDVRDDPNYVAVLPETRSQLSCPILWEDTVMGVITLESNRTNAFSEEDTYFVQQLANQAAIAVENARLFRSTSEARDRMQVILNTIKEALILIDTEGNVVLTNPRIELIGLAPERLIGYSIIDLLEDEQLDLCTRIGFRTGGELLRLVRELRAPSGLAPRESKTFTVEPSEEGDEVAYVERQIFPVYDEDEHPLGVLLVFYDETEEMRLSKTREEVSQMLVHDLRSPLTAMVTSLKLITELSPKDSDRYPLIETTVETSRRAVRKLLGRVDSLLDVARMENNFMTVEQKPTELATIVDNVCVELSPIAQELSVAVKSDLNTDLPLLDMDGDKIERVLLNLVDNALKFSPPDSSVIVRSYEPGAEGAAPGFVRIDVIDAGPGVPDEYKLMLFDRFVQVRGRKGSRRGTGLGLTFCRLVAEAHGGRIWISDNPTGGSIFSFTLPAALENELSLGTD